ncbi:hypothetical protein ENBRE01_2286 [Enteropsectra breve]|nr:hypothetical protein ENBRE01_2286 [Enteropsectra breve]
MCHPRYSIDENLGADRKSIAKVIDSLIAKMPTPDFAENKPGGPGMIVQVDETMLYHAVKNHRGRSLFNKTDALVIVELNRRVNRVFACIIPDKRAKTMIHIILSQVASNSKIYTDEHKSYGKLGEFFAEHCTVCHNYEFINKLTVVNTQAVETINNLIKLEIKRRQGIKTTCRANYLKKFCFKWNNKDALWDALLELIKIH